MATTNYDIITLDQFISWLEKTNFKRTITWMAWHHTASPNTSDVKAKGFQHYVKAVQRVHIKDRGWQDQAQHINVNNADGKIILGRDLNIDGGGIKSDPKGDITVEVYANFDTEIMTDECRKTILGIAWACSKKFGIPLSEKGHKYHNWFDLNTGKELLDGQAGARKTCPGKNFFGGYSRYAFNTGFLPALIAYGKSLEKVDKLEETVLALSNAKCKDGKTPVTPWPESWKAIFNGTQITKGEYIMTLVRRLLKLE